MSKTKDLVSIGEAYADVLNKVIVEDKTVPEGEIGNAPLESGGPEERGGFEPAAIDIDRMTDKEKDENLYNIKGLTYGDGNDPGIGNQEPLPTGPNFDGATLTGNVGGPEEDEETHDKTGHLSDKALLAKVRKRKGAAGKALLDKAQKEIDDSPTDSLSPHTRDSLARDAYEDEEDEEILSEHEKNARRSLNNFMAKQSVFDKLYNKVMVSENYGEFEEVEEIDDLEALGIESEEPEDITVTIPSELAQTLCDILTAALEDQEVDVETEVDVEETIDFDEDAEETEKQKKFGGNKGDKYDRRFDKKTGRKSEVRPYGGKHGDHPEEDEEAQMKDGGGYGVDAGSTLSKEINYGKKNRVGRLRPAGGAVMKDGGGYGVDAGSTLSKEVDYALKNNKVGNIKLGNIPGA